jgi:hypothetical protein
MRFIRGIMSQQARLFDSAYDTDAQAYFTKLEDDDFTLTNDQKTWVNNRVLNLKGFGAGDISGANAFNCWSLIECLVFGAHNAGSGSKVYAVVGSDCTGTITWDGSGDGFRTAATDTFVGKNGALTWVDNADSGRFGFAVRVKCITASGGYKAISSLSNSARTYTRSELYGTIGVYVSGTGRNFSSAYENDTKLTIMGLGRKSGSTYYKNEKAGAASWQESTQASLGTTERNDDGFRLGNSDGFIFTSGVWMRGTKDLTTNDMDKIAAMFVAEE